MNATFLSSPTLRVAQVEQVSPAEARSGRRSGWGPSLALLSQAGPGAGATCDRWKCTQDGRPRLSAHPARIPDLASRISHLASVCRAGPSRRVRPAQEFPVGRLNTPVRRVPAPRLEAPPA